MANEPRGALTRLQEDTKLAYSTIINAVRPKRPVGATAAKLISDATGGAVSIEELVRSHEAVAESADSSPPSAA